MDSGQLFHFIVAVVLIITAGFSARRAFLNPDRKRASSDVVFTVVFFGTGILNAVWSSELQIISVIQSQNPSISAPQEPTPTTP